MHALQALFPAFLVGSLAALAGCGVDPASDDDPGATPDGEIATAEDRLLREDAAALLDSSVVCVPAIESYTFDASTSPYVDAIRGGERIARFTVGSRTVTVLGYQNRTFSTTGTDGSTVRVRHAWRVRTMQEPFNASTSHAETTAWLRSARQANCDGDKDVLTIASQYAEGRSQVWSGGLRIAGDARHSIGCDFHDYLGTDWAPPDGPTRDPDLGCQANGAVPDLRLNPSVPGALDCSGFIRMIYSGRNNFTALADRYAARIEPSSFRYPLSTASPASHLPREGHDQYRYGPGRKIIPFRVAAAPTRAELDKLLPGDLVFFNLSDSDAGRTCCEPSTPDRDDTCCEGGITHTGLFMGQEEGGGGYRIMSSRNSMSGPTMGGTSFIDLDTGDGWSRRLRAARRL